MNSGTIFSFTSAHGALYRQSDDQKWESSSIQRKIKSQSLMSLKSRYGTGTVTSSFAEPRRVFGLNFLEAFTLDLGINYRSNPLMLTIKKIFKLAL